MAGRGLNVLEARSVLQRHGDKGRAHRVGAVAPLHSNPPRVLLEDPSDLLAPERSPGEETRPASHGEKERPVVELQLNPGLRRLTPSSCT
jgi:hypothetical protein